MAKKSSGVSGTALVIVESPAKARTISKFLGRGYTIEASIGHIRDLPQGAKEIPEQYKKEEWAYLGVDVNHGFEPVYVIPRAKGQQVRKLKGLLKGASESIWPPTKTERGRPLVGISARFCSRRCPFTGSFSTKSPRRRSATR